ncbi:hypothetical protein [Primorskyibacter flagellatus]|uniref:Uncharacterized protein n=1 Tax=Primorskyibacter flagellatus TaxID=1387277 RepID=A0A1W2C4H1_9RHOB|nr:hypothetical protein [Primorskyibacter flagellatus]SMC79904.1 hypothetical protein SAMN06295998_10612 [Primorskyibacter flagellatus]
MSSTPLHVAVGFLAMGGWAVFANAGHGLRAMLLAGLVQGLISGALTLGLKRSVDWMRPRMARGPGYWVPPLIAICGSALLLVLTHWLSDTPEIAATIAVPLGVSLSYIFAYNIQCQYRSRNRG